MSKEKGLNLITMTIVLMVLYNIIYLLGEYQPNILRGIIQPVYSSIKSEILIFSILEALGAVSLFVDMIIGWDNREGRVRKVHTWIVILIVLLFLLKFAFRVFSSMMPDFG